MYRLSLAFWHLIYRRPLLGVALFLVIGLGFALLAYIALRGSSGMSVPSVTQCGADPSGKTDSTTAFNNCLTSHPRGAVYVPAGEYKLDGFIVKNRSQNLIGAGSQASILKCQSTTLPCVVVADTSGAANYAYSRIESMTIQGPGIDNTSIGVFLGGDPSNRVISAQAFADGAQLIDVRVTGFNHGVEWGNNASANKFVRSLVFGNATGLYVPSATANSGESIGLTDTALFNNRDFGVDDHANYEWMMSGSSFDFNGVAIQFLGSTIHASNMHFEQSKGHVVFQPYGAGSFSLRDSEIVIQGSTGSDNSILDFWPQTLNLYVADVSIWSNHSYKYFLHAGGVTTGSLNSVYGNGNKNIHGLTDNINQITTAANSAF